MNVANPASRTAERAYEKGAAGKEAVISSLEYGALKTNRQAAISIMLAEYSLEKTRGQFHGAELIERQSH